MPEELKNNTASSNLWRISGKITINKMFQFFAENKSIVANNSGFKLGDDYITIFVENKSIVTNQSSFKPGDHSTVQLLSTQLLYIIINYYIFMVFTKLIDETSQRI